MTLTKKQNARTSPVPVRADPLTRKRPAVVIAGRSYGNTAADEVRTVACRTPRWAATKAASSSSSTSAGPRSTLRGAGSADDGGRTGHATGEGARSEEHTSELQSHVNLVC